MFDDPSALRDQPRLVSGVRVALQEELGAGEGGEHLHRLAARQGAGDHR